MRKIKKMVKASAKYKIDRPVTKKSLASDLDPLNEFLKGFDKGEIVPYARIEYIHPRSGKHEIIELSPEGNIQGVEWVEKTHKRPYCKRKFSRQWFLAGMTVTGAIFCLAYMVWRLL